MTYVRLTPVGYYADFIIYPMFVVGLSCYALAISWPYSAAFLIAACSGVIGWTLLEYLFHRFTFHEWPYFRDMHELHHADPSDRIGTPTWLSLSSVIVLFFLPAWVLAGVVIACGVTTGIMTGYCWYVITHHGLHRWRARPGTYFHRVWRHHARHHYDKRPGNFGVTTAIWDRVFRTMIDKQR